MKITIVGKWGAYPDKNSATVSFLIEHEGFKMLIDCGSGVLSTVQNYINPTELDALMLSHYHHDHKADVGPLQYYMLIQTQLGNRKEPFPIYGHANDQDEFAALTFEPFTVGKEIQAGKQEKIGPFTIDFLPTVHPAYCLAMKFTVDGKTFVYSADTEWTDPLVDFTKGADLFLCEASLYNQQKGHVKGHLTAGEVGELAAQADVNKVILTHFPHYGDHQQLVSEAKEKFQGDVVLSEAGLIFEL